MPTKKDSSDKSELRAETMTEEEFESFQRKKAQNTRERATGYAEQIEPHLSYSPRKLNSYTSIELDAIINTFKAQLQTYKNEMLKPVEPGNEMDSYEDDMQAIQAELNKLNQALKTRKALEAGSEVFSSSFSSRSPSLSNEQINEQINDQIKKAQTKLALYQAKNAAETTDDNPNPYQTDIGTYLTIIEDLKKDIESRKPEQFASHLSPETSREIKNKFTAVLKSGKEGDKESDKESDKENLPPGAGIS